jgi:hypothetical protein
VLPLDAASAKGSIATFGVDDTGPRQVKTCNQGPEGLPASQAISQENFVADLVANHAVQQIEP